MKIPSTHQIREWDNYTILHEPISSIDLMERAAQKCFNWINEHIASSHYCIVAGTGNNGADGLAIARMLYLAGNSVRVVIIGDVVAGSDDFRHNLRQLTLFPELSVSIHYAGESSFSALGNEWIIDALIGSGLSRAIEGPLSKFIDELVPFSDRIISIDLPSGMNGDLMEPQVGSVVRASYTLTFEILKRSFFFPENECYIGKVIVIDIGLDKAFNSGMASDIQVISIVDAAGILKERKKFSYKNQYGHLQVIAGSTGKMGAAVLCANAALRAGCGLVTSCVPSSGISILQTALPEAMCQADENGDYLYSTAADNTKSALAIGPGIGQQPETSLMLRKIISDSTIPMVIDADALNIIAKKDLLTKLPSGTILTPHSGEFDRLFGHHTSSFERVRTQRKISAAHTLIIVLKGAHTSVSLPSGELYFNSTGNPGMATAGSGDVLTGAIGSLLAQGYSTADAAIAGVFIHGLAGDLIAEQQGTSGMLAGDIVLALPYASQMILSTRVDHTLKKDQNC